MQGLAAAIATDARARTGDEIRRTQCEPYPRTVERTGLTSGRYACVAVTSEFDGGVIGHQYRALVDLSSGRYAYCKVISQSGPERDQLVTTPRACGG